MKLKLPPHLRGHQGVVKSSSPMEKVKKKRKPFLPANKKNYIKYKHKVKGMSKSIPGGEANVLWKFIPDVKD